MIALDRAPSSSKIRWNRLAQALDLLAKATSSQDACELFATHALRGDAELIRFRLLEHSELSDDLKTASVRETLLNNAEKYYRGAFSVARKAPSDVEENLVNAVLVKGTLMRCILQGHPGEIQMLNSGGLAQSKIVEALKDCVSELLVSQETLAHCGLEAIMLNI